MKITLFDFQQVASPHGTKWDAWISMAVFGFFPVFRCASCGLRHYKNVYSDCERLIEWMAIEKNENGLVFAPYDEIVVDMKLPDRHAA